MEQEQSIIRLESLPVLKDSIKEAGIKFREMAYEAGLDKEVVVTPENRGAIKKLVADITKKFNEFEDSRKALKNELMRDYESLMVVYKENIVDNYNEIVKQAKDAILASEKAEIEEKEQVAKQYFAESCTAHGIDYVAFSNGNFKINLSISEKKIREEIDAFFERLIDNQNLIAAEEYKVEIFAEYKRNGLNASKAILEVKARKSAEKAEAERLNSLKYNNRCAELRRIGMVGHTFPPMFDYPGNTDIAISIEAIREMSDVDFNATLSVFKTKIHAHIYPQGAAVAPAPTAQAPVEVAPEKPVSETQTISFQATATIAQFKELAQFMRENNIIFKTI